MAFIFYTGDVVTESLLDDPKVNAYADLRFIDRLALWSGCIDAPDYIPAGGMRAVTVPGEDSFTAMQYAKRPGAWGL